jgi:RimJ/RimL family protein N-acetyltransferase
MDLRQFGPDDGPALRECVRVRNAVRGHDSPWQHPLTEAELAGSLRYGWDLEPPVPFLADVDGGVVGYAAYSISRHDNLHLAWLTVEVHPDHRRRGHGSTALEALVQRVKELGRTSVGLDGWDSDGPRAFATRHGFARASVAVNRRQTLAEIDWADVERRHAEARERARDYELVRRTGRSPDEELAALAEMTSAINDAPTDDLDIEDEVFTADRIRDYETAQLARSSAFHRLYARHRATGELAGQTVVAVEADRPELAEQHDTSVVRAHRGHRLGLLLKAEMMLWLRESQPQLVSIDTWNAESNDFMIGVNEALGYRIVGRERAFQRTV